MRSFPVRLLLAAVLALPVYGSAEPDTSPWKIINYWSITCAPCRIEIPELNRLSEKLAGDVELLGVNFDEDNRDRTMEIAERMGIEFPTLRQHEVDALGITPPNVLPTTVILAPDGTVRATLIGAQTEASIRAALSDLMEQAS